MTDQELRTLLHDAAATLTIPTPAADSALREGRRLRRRRRTGLVGGIAAVVLAVAAGGYAVMPHRGGTVALDPATAPAATEWAVAQGGTLHLGSGAVAHVPGQVKAIYYTSAGMLVRVGATPYTDAPDSNYWLARSDGSVSDFRLALGDRVPGTDPSLPYIAYAKAGSDAHHWTIVLRDVRTGEVATSIPITGAFTWGGWVAPPVALSGDHVYVGVDDTLLDVQWRTGKVRRTSVSTHMPEVHAGRDVVPVRSGVTEAVDLASGRVLQTFHTGTDSWPHVSTDGTHVLTVPTAICTDKGGCSYRGKPAHIYDLATGARTAAPTLEYGAFGWTATGRLLVVDGQTVKSCDPDTLACEATPVRLSSGAPIRVSGNDNES
jgi:hypothetical protein